MERPTVSGLRKDRLETSTICHIKFKTIANIWGVKFTVIENILKALWWESVSSRSESRGCVQLK